MSRLTSGSFLQLQLVSLDFCAKKFQYNCTNSNKIVIFTYNLKTKQYESAN